MLFWTAQSRGPQVSRVLLWTAPGRTGVPTAHRSRQATHAGEVRVGDPLDAEGHNMFSNAQRRGRLQHAV